MRETARRRWNACVTELTRSDRNIFKFANLLAAITGVLSIRYADVKNLFQAVISVVTVKA
jgi:hypothetical protein